LDRGIVSNQFLYHCQLITTDSSMRFRDPANGAIVLDDLCCSVAFIQRGHEPMLALKRRDLTHSLGQWQDLEPRLKRRHDSVPASRKQLLDRIRPLARLDLFQDAAG